MQNFSDDFYNKTPQTKITEELQHIDEFSPSMNDLLSSKHHHTCHLALWHDGSTLSNHSHLLMMVNILYDSAIFYTPEEYKQKTGKFF